MTAVKQPRPLAELASDGKKLFRAIVADAAAQGLELEAKELEWLKQAGRIADRIHEMESVLARADGMVVPGHARQPVGHPMISEIRMHRELLTRVLARLRTDVPAESGAVSPVPRSVAARSAARVRWSK